MGQHNRLVFKQPVGPHKDHIMVVNRRKGVFAGKTLLTTILRCYSCHRDGIVVAPILNQEEVHHE